MRPESPLLCDMPSPTLKPRLNENLNWEPIEDGCVIYSTESTVVITLNALAELLLTYCDGESSLAEIYSILNDENPIPVAEFDALVERLLTEGILVTPP